MTHASAARNARRKRALQLLVLFDIVVLALVGVFVAQRQGWLARWLPKTTPVQLAASSSTPAGVLAAPVDSPAPTIASATPQPPTLTFTPAPPTLTFTPAPPSGTPTPTIARPPGQALVIISADENGYAHLFALRPSSAERRRLTNGAWDDMFPSLSPDGSRLAFASNREGVWDLFALDMTTGEITRLTNSSEYDGHPSWSPDGLWLAYESYVPDAQGGGSLEVFIRPVDDSQPPIRLTDDPGGDYAPVWSPSGRQLAFVSDRSGDAEIWLADLDKAEDRFANVSRLSSAQDGEPAWAPDGRRLAWVSRGDDGLAQVLVWSLDEPDLLPRSAVLADQVAWSGDGGLFAAVIEAPNASYWTVYDASGSGMTLPLLPLPGTAHGLAFGSAALPDDLPEVFAEAAAGTPAPLWTPDAIEPAGEDVGRTAMMPLEGVQADYPALANGVDEAFSALRLRLAQASGWDFLETLEQAFLPLTSPLTPGIKEEWAYTGRSIRFNTAAVSAGWLIVEREAYGPQTFWRVFLRARFQDGQQGQPLRIQPWDLTARFGGDPLAYEQGGAWQKAPPGYWVDLTRLALAYGWQRLPALSTWRLAYSSTRFNELVFTQNLDWFEAMLQVYPRSALNTPTPVLSPTVTSTPSITPTTTLRPTITRRPTYTPTLTRTLRPTTTPVPTRTPRPTSPATATRTPRD